MSAPNPNPSEPKPEPLEENSIRTIGEREIKTVLIVDRVLWGRVRNYATVLNVHATRDLAELAFRILVAIFDAKRIPDDFADFLHSRDPQALEQLLLYIDKLRKMQAREP